jgi:hypothetical protein
MNLGPPVYGAGVLNSTTTFSVKTMLQFSTSSYTFYTFPAIFYFPLMAIKSLLILSHPNMQPCVESHTMHISLSPEVMTLHSKDTHFEIKDYFHQFHFNQTENSALNTHAIRHPGQ